MILTFARPIVSVTCVLACAVAYADYPQRLHVIMGDGYTKIAVSDGTSFKTAQYLGEAMTANQYDGLTLSVVPTVSFAGVEHRSICIAINPHEHCVLLSVPLDTPMQLASNLVLAIEEAGHGAVVLLSRKSFDAALNECDGTGTKPVMAPGESSGG